MPFLFSPEVRLEKSAFFAAMNTPTGFLSSFSELFSHYRCYVIKGGPGTGKSTLMRKIAKEAERRGLEVTYYYCSSDTASLDAITIDALKLALLDGTSPHATEPILVGVKDHYLDLAQFLSPALIHAPDQIAALSEKKQECYRRAYTLLSACHTADVALDDLRSAYFESEKCQKTLERLLDRLHLTEESEPTATKTQQSALGSDGYVALDSYADKTRIVIRISDRYGVAPAVFSHLTNLLEKHAVSYTYSLSPLTLSPDTVYLLQKGVMFSALPLSGDPSLVINCERFLKKRGQGLYKNEKSLLCAEKILFTEAISAFRSAAEAHREMERHYIHAMNFTALNTYTDSLIRDIFRK